MFFEKLSYKVLVISSTSSFQSPTTRIILNVFGSNSKKVIITEFITEYKCQKYDLDREVGHAEKILDWCSNKYLDVDAPAILELILLSVA
ncbi:hypothetical protein HOD61_01690 [archaeon]|jgi:hypothetical protein|nr:hypothetical protein [archaeon]